MCNQAVFSNHFFPVATKYLLKVMTFLYFEFVECLFDLIIWYWYMYSIIMYNFTLIMFCVVGTFNLLRSGKSSGIFVGIAIFYIGWPIRSIYKYVCSFDVHLQGFYNV